MSRIKYYIFVFFVIITTQIYPQNNFEGNIVLEKNQIERYLFNADQEKVNDNYCEAIKNLKNALEIAKKIDDRKNQGIILSRLAELQLNTDEADEAIVSATKAVAIQTALDDKVNLAVTRYTFGLIHMSQEKYLEALDYFKSAKTIFEEESLSDLIAEVTVSEANAHIGLGNLNFAKTLLDKAIVLSTKHSIPLLESTAQIKSGMIALKQGKFDKALSQTTKGMELAETLEAPVLINEGHFILSEIYTKTGQHKLAADNLRSYITLNETILAQKRENLSPEKRDQLINADKDALIQTQAEELKEKNEATSLNKLTTILSVALITILSLLTLSLYKNNNIRLKTNNMLYKKNEELLTEKERAEIAAKTKTNFLSTVTHELRTPLYAVTGLTNMLLEEDPKPEQMQHLKSLKFSGDYLLTFINDILQINKVEANKVELDPEIFNLKNKVENVISALNNSAVDNNIMIHYQYDKNLPEVFNGDQLKLSQILINLIGNSIKFTKDGDIWVRVNKVRKNKKNFIVKLEVEDNGIGISEEKQQNMFESFSQGSVQINRKYGGTGLGLSIVKGLIEILKGRIYMESELGTGTKFTVEIPLEETQKEVKTSSNDFSNKLNNLDLSKVNILVVEDNKINQMITKKILTKMNLNCQVVDNGEDAVELVRENNFDVVLMDIHMPGISGLEATKRIRSFDKEQTIFALTAVTLEDKMQEFEEAGFDDIISKPFKQEDFEKKLYNALSQAQTSASA